MGKDPSRTFKWSPFLSRHHMSRQQELSKCHPADTLIEIQQNDRNNEDKVPTCEHLRPFKIWRAINDLGVRSRVGGAVHFHPSIGLISSEAPNLLPPDQRNTAGFISKNMNIMGHCSKSLFCQQTGNAEIGPTHQDVRVTSFPLALLLQVRGSIVFKITFCILFSGIRHPLVQ